MPIVHLESVGMRNVMTGRRLVTLVVIATGASGCGARTGLDVGSHEDGGVADAPAPDVRVVQIAAGYAFTCALRLDGVVLCWGFNESGQLGDGTTTSRATPEPVHDLDDAAVIATADHRACAVRRGGGVVCWGTHRDAGGEPVATLEPARVEGLTGAMGVGVAAGHACAVDSAGGVWCWGRGSAGQTGAGVVDYDPTPRLVPGLDDVEQVGVGEDFSCALRRGEVLCWGSDAHSRSGGPDDGTLVLAPRPVPQLTDAVWLGVGLTHGCAVTASGEVRCWGQNLERCLGFSTSYCCSADAGAVDTISGAVEVDGSYPHSCARLEDGAVWCWGLNSFGQLGQDVASESPPVRVLGIDDAVGIATGEYHNCAILASRDVVCWGTNASGALGGGTTAGQSTSPVVAIEGPER